MKVIVDTSVWSLALRRSKDVKNEYVEELEELIKEVRAQLIGPVGQELLNGIRLLCAISTGHRSTKSGRNWRYIGSFNKLLKPTVTHVRTLQKGKGRATLRWLSSTVLPLISIK